MRTKKESWNRFAFIYIFLSDVCKLKNDFINISRKAVHSMQTRHCARLQVKKCVVSNVCEERRRNVYFVLFNTHQSSYFPSLLYRELAHN